MSKLTYYLDSILYGFQQQHAAQFGTLVVQLSGGSGSGTWTIDGTSWHSGAGSATLEAGQIATVQFGAVSGWVTPSPLAALIPVSSTASVTGVYREGYPVTMQVAGLSQGGGWSVDGGATWMGDGDSATRAVGTSTFITAKAVSGYSCYASPDSATSATKGYVLYKKLLGVISSGQSAIVGETEALGGCVLDGGTLDLKSLLFDAVLSDAQYGVHFQVASGNEQFFDGVNAGFTANGGHVIVHSGYRGYNPGFLGWMLDGCHVTAFNGTTIDVMQGGGIQVVLADSEQAEEQVNVSGSAAVHCHNTMNSTKIRVATGGFVNIVDSAGSQFSSQEAWLPNATMTISSGGSALLNATCIPPHIEVMGGGVLIQKGSFNSQYGAYYGNSRVNVYSGASMTMKDDTWAYGVQVANGGYLSMGQGASIDRLAYGSGAEIWSNGSRIN